MDKCVQLYLGTVLIGDPQNPPVLKASNQFDHDHVVYAKDPNYGGTVNFYVGMKNVIIDSTDVDPNKRIALLDWTVSQSTQLTNVVFKMPPGAEGHVGLTTEYDYNSNIIMVCVSARLWEQQSAMTDLYRTISSSTEATLV